MNMKIIDFDKKFFEYARKWVMAHPGLNEDQIEEHFNEMMQNWISQPADWLDGAAPQDYFKRFESADDLIALMVAYSEANVNLPEPLYSRIVEMGADCAPLLMKLLQDENRSESLRAEAMGMLRDMDTHLADGYLEDLVCGAQESNELSDMAADILSSRSADVVSHLMDRYDAATDYAKLLILDVCCNFPGDDRIYDRLIHQLHNDPEQRALWASCLGKLGDERAIEPMRAMLDMLDLKYLDYIELRAAVESLGGDVGEERSFYGDPDFEALRSL